ncbi:hypothetical protein N183_24645 [Sinorhizobium sp. Sb3]|nr:hypothetical protein N183_24645 [Sinorhizobium sp. Sb3]
MNDIKLIQRYNFLQITETPFCRGIGRSNLDKARK